MKYFKAYLNAFKQIFIVAGTSHLFLSIFVDVPRILVPYIAYLCIATAFGAPLHLAMTERK